VNLNFQEPSGPLRACNGTAFYVLEYFYTEVQLYKYRGTVCGWLLV